MLDEVEGRGERERMEKNLQVQSLSVEPRWRLYTEIIDEQVIMAPGVQCRLQQAKQGTRAIIN